MLWVALYAAALSTALALMKLIPEWPVVSVVPQERRGDYPLMVGLSVFNPSRRSLIIDGNWQFPRGVRPYRLSERRDRYAREDIVLAIQQNLGAPHLEPRVYVSGPGEVVLDVTGIEDGPNRKRWVVLWWHRNWLIPLRLPVWVPVSADLASVVDGRLPDA
jgi:hypothetical protein